MSLTKDGFWKQTGGVIGDNSYVLLGSGGLIKYGNATGNIPLSNGTKNTDLNADLLNGYHANTLLSNASFSKVNTESFSCISVVLSIPVAFFFISFN